jgi:hypothetical protein
MEPEDKPIRLTEEDYARYRKRNERMAFWLAVIVIVLFLIGGWGLT